MFKSCNFSGVPAAAAAAAQKRLMVPFESEMKFYFNSFSEQFAPKTGAITLMVIKI